MGQGHTKTVETQNQTSGNMSLWLLSSPYIKTSLFSGFYSKSTERAIAPASINTVIRNIKEHKLFVALSEAL